MDKNIDYKNEIVKAFNESSTRFDEIGTPFFRMYGEKLADFADIQKGDCILDIACGKGAVTFPIAKKIDGHGRVVGIDISGGMIKGCKEILDETSLLCTEFYLMDAENLEFSDNTFDKIICGFGLFFLPDFDKAINEIRRVLKKGGNLVFSSWNDEYRLKWLYGKIAELLPDMAEKRTISKYISQEDFNTVSGLEKILDAFNFKNDGILMKNISSYYKNEKEWFNRYWNTGFRIYFSKLSGKKYKNFEKFALSKIKDYYKNGKIEVLMSAFFTKAIKL